MVQYLFKFALRSFRRNRPFFLINILGLSLSLAAFLVIHNYVAYERSFDRHHANHEEIFRVVREYGGESPTTYSNCFAAVGPHAAEGLPEVSSFGRVLISDKVMTHMSLSHQDGEDRVIAFNHTGAFFADQGIADFFISDWVEGGPEGVLTEPNQIVMSQSVAKMYFGEGSALGKQLRLNGEDLYVVSGIFADPPDNTHLPLSILLSMKSLPARWDLDNEWGWGNFHTYLKASSSDELEERIYEMASAHLKPDEGLPERFGLQPLADIHLHSDLRHEIQANGSASTIKFLQIIAWMILIIGLINYVNLYTAKAVDMVRSIVLKKVIGSNRSRILIQLLFDSLLMGLFAAAIALTASQFLARFLEMQYGLHLLWEPLQQVENVAIFLAGIMAVSIYPTYLISRIPTRQLSRTDWRIAGGVSLRKGLVIFQFSLTTLLIIATIIVHDQKEFMIGHETGFQKEQVLVVKTPATVKENHHTQFGRFATSVQSTAGVDRVGMTAHLPGYEVTRMRWIQRRSADPDVGSYPRVIAADPGFFQCLEFDLLAGRFFAHDFRDDSSLVINEATMLELGFESAEQAVGQQILFEGREHEIVGVMDNFHQRSLRSTFQPIIFVYRPSLYQYYTVALSSRDLEAEIERVEQAYLEHYPQDPFDFFFLDTYFDQQYAQDIVLGQVTRMFSMLAIVIALFGLAGLALFSVNQRIKEIGIRKVLGASWKELVWLFNASFLRLIAVSSVISIPIAYWLMSNWLRDYAYRIELQAMHFLLPLVFVLVIAFLIVVAVVSRFVNVNPTETLRSE